MTDETVVAGWIPRLSIVIDGRTSHIVGFYKVQVKYSPTSIDDSPQNDVPPIWTDIVDLRTTA